MRQPTQLSAIEYFAALTLGQRMGQAKDLTFKHGLLLLCLLIGLSMAFLVAIGAIVAMLDLKIGLFGGIRMGKPALGKELSLGLACLLIPGLVALVWFAGIGLNALALRFINRTPTTVWAALLAPASGRFGGVLVSLMLWAAIGGLCAIPLSFILLIPLAGFWLYSLGLGFYQLLATIAGLYIADCVNRGRHFKITETVSKTFRLLFSNFGLWLSSILAFQALSLPSYILYGLSMYMLSDSQAVPALIFFSLGAAYALPLPVFNLFLMAITYKQAKARLLINQSRLSRRRRG